MGLHDAVSYLLFTNPISSTAASSVKYYLGQQPKIELKMSQPVPLWKLAKACGPYVRLAGISGTTAVLLSAYATHRLPLDKLANRKEIFDIANHYHFLHTLALLGLPLCRVPYVAATFFVAGKVLFCGSCYYHAFTGDDRFKRITPYGGVCFIIGWLSMIL